MADVVDVSGEKRRRSLVASSVSIDSDGGQNEALDPRIFVELEKLNATSDEINSLECEANNLRSELHSQSSENIKRLSSLADKLGSCVERARPYYDARIKLIEVQLKAQDIAQRYEKAHGDLCLAKEMVRVAEDRYSALGCPNDSAWQEMLNHSTIKVNDAEIERKRSELEHERMTQQFTEAQQTVTRLQKEQKRSIAKSKPYFEMKAAINLEMEENKKKLQELECKITQVKTVYTKTLRTLEKISDEIHHQRKSNIHKRISMKRELDVMPDGSNERFCDTVNANLSSTGFENEANMSKSIARNAIVDVKQRDAADGVSIDDNSSAKFESRPLKDVNCVHLYDAGTAYAEPASHLQSSHPLESYEGENHGKTIAPFMQKTFQESQPSSPNIGGHSENGHNEQVTDPHEAKPGPQIFLRANTETVDDADSNNNPGQNIDPIHTNAEVMKSIMQVKSAADSHSLVVHRGGHDNLRDDLSDLESVTSSYVGANLLSDEQIESLMLDTSDYRKLLEGMSTAEIGRFKDLELPAKLSYLQKYLNFDPIWIEDDFDGFVRKSKQLVASPSHPVLSAGSNIAK